MLKKQQQQNQQQLHHHQGPSSNQQQQMMKDPQSLNRQQASFNQVDYHLQKQQNQQAGLVEPSNFENHRLTIVMNRERTDHATLLFCCKDARNFYGVCT